MPRGFGVDYNNSIYDYPLLRGSFVDRREVKGDKYTIDIMFDGDNAIVDGETFVENSKDPRPWTIEHPYYGTLRIQPVRLRIDNSTYNVYKITIQCIETLETDQPRPVVDIPGRLNELKQATDVAIVENYVTLTEVPNSEDVQNMSMAVATWDRIESAAIRSQDTLSVFKQEVSRATGFVSNLIQNATSAINSVNALINFPFRVADNLQARFNALEEAYNSVKGNVIQSAELGAVSQRDRVFFEALGASVVSTAALISIVEPDPTEVDESLATTEVEETPYSLRDDYPSRQSLLNQIERIQDLYRDYIVTLDSITTDRADEPDSFTPNDDVIFNLTQLVVFSMRDLEAQIFETAQEREFVLTDDTDIINVTHRFIGLDSEDRNIDRMIEINGFSVNDMLELRKGRTVRYYV